MEKGRCFYSQRTYSVALEVTEEIYKKAKAENNTAQIVKAVLAACVLNRN